MLWLSLPFWSLWSSFLSFIFDTCYFSLLSTFAFVPSVQNKSNIELELKTWKQNFEQEKLSHEADLAKLNTVKKDLIVSKEEANLEALKGSAIT